MFLFFIVWRSLELYSHHAIFSTSAEESEMILIVFSNALKELMILISGLLWPTNTRFPLVVWSPKDLGHVSAAEWNARSLHFNTFLCVFVFSLDWHSCQIITILPSTIIYDKISLRIYTLTVGFVLFFLPELYNGFQKAKRIISLFDSRLVFVTHDRNNWIPDKFLPQLQWKGFSYHIFLSIPFSKELDTWGNDFQLSRGFLACRNCRRYLSYYSHSQAMNMFSTAQKCCNCPLD